MQALYLHICANKKLQSSTKDADNPCRWHQLRASRASTCTYATLMCFQKMPKSMTH